MEPGGGGGRHDPTRSRRAGRHGSDGTADPGGGPGPLSLLQGAIPLIASENLLSPYAKELLISDFHSRYAEGLPGERYYEGNQWVDEVENLCLQLARDLFQCPFADVRPISGTVANLAVLKALTEPGDRVGSNRLADGAHISSASFGAFGLRGVK
ncbi:serine hydroxymethyltransferase, partial [mine drainage metagenome]